MDEKQEMLMLLRSMERTGRQKLTATILTCIFMLISAAACVVMCVLVGSLIPQVNEILGQVRGVLGNLEAVSGQLTGLDVQTLNKAIEDLAKIIEPLAKIASMLG